MQQSNIVRVLTWSLCYITLFTANVNSYLDQNGVCTAKERTCSQTCDAIAECNRPGIRPFLRGCYGETPFCHLGQCTNIYQPDCNKYQTPLFYCPPQVFDGTYPDPLDCTRYHICLNSVPYSGDCGNHPGLVYSTKTFSCVRQSDENRCGIIDCRNKTSGWVRHSTDPQYASSCLNFHTVVNVRCLRNYEFNVNIGKCEFKCPGEGLFPDFDDENNPYNNFDTNNSFFSPNYFECSLLYGNQYLVTKRNCPNDENVKSVFVPEVSQCIHMANILPYINYPILPGLNLVSTKR